MNVARFQVALNHEDPEIVTRGLESFSNQVLYEHDLLLSFGYHGRCVSGKPSEYLSPPRPTVLKGLLRAYLDSSSQLEELFVLWQLPERDSDRKLCSAYVKALHLLHIIQLSPRSHVHAQCFAFLLHLLTLCLPP
jgi:hypothetical protein